MKDILADTSKFKLLSTDPLKTTINREKHLRSFLLDLKKDEVITREIYQRLAPTCTRPGILYGIPKINKTNLPFRPILSASGIHSYNLSKFLVSLLTPILNSPFIISDTFSFLEDLRSCNSDNNVFMASFDVNSLFTNVPTHMPLTSSLIRLLPIQHFFTAFPLPSFENFYVYQ